MANGMELSIAILARGDQAVQELKKIQSEMAKTAGFFDQMTRSRTLFGAETFAKVRADLEALTSTAGKLTGVFFLPLRLAVTGAIALGGAIAGLAAKSLAAAAADEILEQRLIAVFGTIEKGKKAFADIERMSLSTWMPVEDIVQARIIMKEFGLDSTRNLGAVANAARAAGMSVADMARSVSVLQLKALKSVGIDVKTDDGRYTATYRNALGQIQKLTAKTADDMRRKLMDVFATRFGVSLAPKGLSEFWSMLKNNVDQAFSEIGKPMLDAATRFVKFLADHLKKLVESGKLEKWGKQIGQAMDKGVSWVKALSVTIPKLYDALKNSGTGFVDIVKEGMKSIGTIIMVAIVEGLSATASMWMGVGKMISGAFMEEIMQLPFMKRFREQKAVENYNNMGVIQRLDWGETQGLISTGERKSRAGDPFGLEASLAERLQLTGTPAQYANLSAQGSQQKAIEGFKQFGDALPTLLERVKFTADVEGRRMNNLVNEKTGYDFGADTRKEYEKDQVEKEYEKDQVKKDQILMAVTTYHRRQQFGQINGKTFAHGKDEFSSTMEEAPEGAVDTGGAARENISKNGVGKIVNNIFIRKSDVERTKNEIKKRGWTPAFSLPGA